MLTVKATMKFDAGLGVMAVSLDIQGDSEMEHEVLKAAFAADRSVVLVPAHQGTNGDDLYVKFWFTDTNVFPIAARALENRIRVRAGRPTVEQEEEMKRLARVRQEADEKAQREADAKASEVHRKSVAVPNTYLPLSNAQVQAKEEVAEKASVVELNRNTELS